MPGRVPPGGRTLVGVAPPPPPHAAAPGGGAFTPPGQSRSPSPNDPTVPSMAGVQVTPGAPGAGGAPAPGADGAPAPGAAPAPGPTPAHETGSPVAAGARKPRAGRLIAAVLAVLGVLAIAGVVVGYFVFFRYTPLAERHIPAASNVAIRADLVQIGTFAPVRKHLWPVLFERPSRKAQGKTLADVVSEKTGIHPALDVREIIVASVDARSWVALVGGNLEPGTFVSGLEKVLEEEGYTGWQRSGELLVGPGGITVAQAEDGTLVIGTEAEIVNAALPVSEEYKRMGLPKEGALAFAVTKEAWEELSRSTGTFDPQGSIRRIRHATGVLHLGDEPRVEIDIEPKGGENAEVLGKDVETFFAALRLGLLFLPDQMGEKTALSSAAVAVEQQRVRVRGPWPLEGLERGCAKLVALIGLQ